MFDKFGEFDSAEEMNASAEGLKAEGDTESLIALAKENGLDPEDAMDYMDGITTIFCSPLMAALGKLQIEAEELKPEDIMKDWLEYIRMECGQSFEMAVAVRRKGKTLRGCIAYLLKWSFGHQRDIPKDILMAAGVNIQRVTLGIPGMGTAKFLIHEYYAKEGNADACI